MVYEHYKVSAVDGAVLELQDLMCVRMHNNDLRSFLHDWETVLVGMRKVPDDDVLETLFREQIRDCAKLRDQLAYYNRLNVGGRR